MTAHYFIQKVVKSTGFRKKSGIPCFFVLWMWINLREKNEKGSFSVASPQGGDYEQLDTLLEGKTRAEDFIGLWENKAWVLLPDCTEATLKLVRDRLEKAGLRTGESRDIL